VVLQASHGKIVLSSLCMSIKLHKVVGCAVSMHACHAL
jgi:hypothetical protein